MTCDLCFYDCQELLDKICEDETLAVKIYADHGILPSAIKCPAHEKIGTYNTESKNYLCAQMSGGNTCPYKFSPVKGSPIEATQPQGYSPSSIAMQLKLTCLFLHEVSSEDDMLSRCNINKQTYDLSKPYFLDICNRWLEYQSPIGGDRVGINIDIRSIGFSDDVDISEGKVLTLKATEQSQRIGRGLVMVNIKDSDYHTLVTMICRFIRPGSRLVFNQQEIYHKFLANKCIPMENFVVKYENVNENLRNSPRTIGIEADNDRVWDRLMSCVQLADQRDESYKAMFAKYIFLAISSETKALLHNYLWIISNITSKL